jgi:hypothetical protein
VVPLRDACILSWCCRRGRGHRGRCRRRVCSCCARPTCHHRWRDGTTRCAWSR